MERGGCGFFGRAVGKARRELKQRAKPVSSQRGALCFRRHVRVERSRGSSGQPSPARVADALAALGKGVAQAALMPTHSGTRASRWSSPHTDAWNISKRVARRSRSGAASGSFGLLMRQPSSALMPCWSSGPSSISRRRVDTWIPKSGSLRTSRAKINWIRVVEILVLSRVEGEFSLSFRKLCLSQKVRRQH
jgi:hypothetical protein